ncbi:ATP synthase F1 subunit delta [Pedobacter yulinensis]|uniref:ATP synthase subunit delta n=1 Tax=Pedobacter yulinensis TaxID=2126353 RepID=A0A2T3HNX8_9SPHI|nr:ATP synthase F1 subunit delta [Pedobacter yulinensis]PST84103.1 ATP synthase F1 subunit delta [Pedobacter yulinensis]
MSDTKVATRYAKALIDLANENNALEAIMNDMVLLDRVIDENPELEAIMNNPIVSLDKKVGILNAVFAGNVNAVTSSYFKVLVNKGRSDVLYSTAKEFIRQYQVQKGIVKAEVTSATALTEEARTTFKAIVKKELGAEEVLLNEKVDDKLIGGFILKVGDRQFDASMSGSLSKLRKEFAGK